MTQVATASAQLTPRRRRPRPASWRGWVFVGPFMAVFGLVFPAPIGYSITVGQAYVSDTSLQDGLLAWQEASSTYGNDQGFNVNN